jgi:hypothetical protein
MKQEIIILRATKEIKKKLNKVSKENNRNASDYLRLLIEYAEKNKIKL